MKIEHQIDAVSSTIVQVITDEDHVEDYEYVVSKLTETVLLKGMSERKEIIMIKPSEIIYGETGEQQKSYIMVDNGSYYQINGNLIQLEIKVASIPFICRVNRTTLIHINKVVKAISTGNMKIMIVMQDGSKHIVSRKYQKKFLQQMEGM